MTGRVTGFLVLAAFWGCASLAPVDARQYVPAHRPPSVWVTLRDGSTVILRGPRLMPDGDTLAGFVAGGNQRLISLGDVAATRTLRPAALRSALLAGGAALGITALLVTVTR